MNEAKMTVEEEKALAERAEKVSEQIYSMVMSELPVNMQKQVLISVDKRIIDHYAAQIDECKSEVERLQQTLVVYNG